MEKKDRIKAIVGGALAGAILGYIMRRKPAPIHVERKIDLSRYAGKWYEIAKIPKKSDKGCINTTSEYSMEKGGSFRIVNSCRVMKSGNLKKKSGKAFLSDRKTNSRFNVRMRGPFKKDYQIISVGNDYEYALVGEQSREGLRILSRKPVLSKLIIDDLLDKAKVEGFDVGKVVFTRHNHVQVPCH